MIDILLAETRFQIEMGVDVPDIIAPFCNEKNESSFKIDNILLEDMKKISKYINGCNINSKGEMQYDVKKSLESLVANNLISIDQLKIAINFVNDGEIKYDV